MKKFKKYFFPGSMLWFRSSRKPKSYHLKRLNRLMKSFVKCVFMLINQTLLPVLWLSRSIKLVIIYLYLYFYLNLYLFSRQEFLTYKKSLFSFAGKAVGEFCLRWNNWKNNFKSYDCNQSWVWGHLKEYCWNSSHCGFLDHVPIIFMTNSLFMFFRKSLI